MTKFVLKSCGLFSIALFLVLFSSNRCFAQDTAAQISAAQTPKIHIGPGDLLEVQVFNVPDMTQTVRVDDVGNATLNLIGQVHLADLTVEQAQSLIGGKYSDGHFLVHPQVAVMIKEYVTQGVSVLGEVLRPGVYPVLGKRTVFDVLSEAGGITREAGNKVSVQRASDGSVQTVALSGQHTNSLSSDLILEPGDKVVVPRAGIVYVIGDVNRPGGFVMEDDGHLSLLQALSMAMGTRATASLNKAKLIRKEQSGYMETLVSLKKVLNGKQPDQSLQADDILYVPNSAEKSILYRAAPTAISAATSASIYRTVY